TVVPPNGTVAFANTPVGVALSKTFTVKNTGTATLLVSEAVSTPLGFTLMASFAGVPTDLLPNNVPAFKIDPGASATFTVALNSATAGDFSGPITFQTNVTGKNPMTFNVTGSALPPPSTRFVDDTGAGFTFTAGWTPGYNAAGTS